MALISLKSFHFCSPGAPASRRILMTLSKSLSFVSERRKPQSYRATAVRVLCSKDKCRDVFCRKSHVQLRMRSLSVNESVHLCRDTGSNAKAGERWTEEQMFFRTLKNLRSSQEIFKFLRSLEVMSDTMASGALQRISEVEVDDNGLKNPEDVLENEVFRALCFQFEFQSSKLSNSGLLNALQALIKLRVDPQSTLIARLLSESEERLANRKLTVDNLCSLGESLLELKGPSYAVLEQIVSRMQEKDIENWSPREMAMVYKILQVVVGEREHWDLLNRMNSATLTIAYQLSPKFTSVILNSLVALHQTQVVPLILALCKHSGKHVPHFTDDELVSVLEAFLFFGHREQIFTEALEKHVPKSIPTMHPETVSKVMQYCCQKKILSKPILDAVAEGFISNADSFTTDQITEYIVPFGTLNYLPPNASSLFRKLETILHARLSQFQPHALLNLLHSCVLIQRYPVNFLPKIFSPFFLQQLQAQPPGLDRVVASQLTQLFLTITLECPFYKGPKLLPKYQVNTFLTTHGFLDVHLFKKVKSGLLYLLKKRIYFSSEVSTPYFYTVELLSVLMVKIGFVLIAIICWEKKLLNRGIFSYLVIKLYRPF
ncbi:FAST kinase domain-containing protein 3, mitochondrial isoform X4 [Tympanuchus pallidicinctus]|uniref:FAST kinase domain-containing protein 3, mitochondrial isoform X4 n=1 Tax=Tympanuchus pallidicinctus TaxID=109042 RepID=UPI0022873009|nr:FAST kinase domain-containing protein 3, mitochondrial isoform X4 [Tympanuchus pallidicinctus]